MKKSIIILTVLNLFTLLAQAQTFNPVTGDIGMLRDDNLTARFSNRFTNPGTTGSFSTINRAQALNINSPNNIELYNNRFDQLRIGTSLTVNQGNDAALMPCARFGINCPGGIQANPSLDPMLSRPDYAQLVYGMNNPNIPNHLRINQLAQASGQLNPFINGVGIKYDDGGLWYPGRGPIVPKVQQCTQMPQICAALARIEEIKANNYGGTVYNNPRNSYMDSRFGQHRDYYDNLLIQQEYNATGI